MSTFIITVLKLLGSILSGGLLFQAFVTRNHAKPITKIAGVIVSILTLLMFFIDIKAFGPSNQTDEIELLYWQSVEKHPSAKAYHSYLTEYPEGKFAAIARERIAYYAEINEVTETAKVVNDHVSLEKQQPVMASNELEFSMASSSGTQTERTDPFSESKQPEPILLPEQKPDAKKPHVWQAKGRYRVTDDLVKDTRTGLMWMRCSVGQDWHAENCQGQPITYRWQEAMSLAAYFNFAGYHDWRIPNRDELKTLVVCSNEQMESLAVGRRVCRGNYAKPTIDSAIFPQTPQGWFWSLSSDDLDDHTAWGVNFSDGYDGWDFKYNKNWLRLVRREKIPAGLK